MNALYLAEFAVITLLVSAVVAVVGLGRTLTFALLGLGGASAAISGGSTLLGRLSVNHQVGMGLPWLHWHLALDPLSGFFLFLIGLITVGVAVYGPQYASEFQSPEHPFPVLGLFTGIFVAAMLLVVLAADALTFMVAWESMSLSSYFLVAFQHEQSANRRAAFLYLLMAHLGGLCILLGFGVLSSFGGAYTFEVMRHAALSPSWASVVFGLVLFGFGMKAGMVPLHAWLPEAHPAAPSHVSALMSGVMLKVAIYGLLRLSYDLLGGGRWEWGLALLLLGCITALMGILLALMQRNLKRLLAYSSVENIGIIFIALGLSMLFSGQGHPVLAALGLIAALYHAINHALFKSLLFLGAGAVLHQTHELEMDRMGGLMRTMPRTALLFLVGCVAIAGLPPLNGFVSEWLTFQAALQAPVLENGVLKMVIPIAAAVLALIGALAAACFVKVFGVVFLGQPRTHHVAHARDVGWGMIAGQGWLALWCFLLGIFPGVVVRALEGISTMLLGVGLPDSKGGIWLAPLGSDIASFSPVLVCFGILAVWWMAYWVTHRSGGDMRQVPAWDCGFGPLTSRMQYTAVAFAMPIRRVFRMAWRVREEIREEPVHGNKPALHHELHVEDRSWNWFYRPVAIIVQKMARRVSRIQTGNIRVYLSYSFVTLLVMLWLIG